jgi:hypothetical protein
VSVVVRCPPTVISRFRMRADRRHVSIDIRRGVRVGVSKNIMHVFFVQVRNLGVPRVIPEQLNKHCCRGITNRLGRQHSLPLLVCLNDDIAKAFCAPRPCQACARRPQPTFLRETNCSGLGFAAVESGGRFKFELCRGIGHRTYLVGSNALPVTGGSSRSAAGTHRPTTGQCGSTQVTEINVSLTQICHVNH